MKRFNHFFGFAVFMLFFTFSQNLSAQLQVGAGLTYGSEVEDPGINLRVGYGITEKIDAVANYSIFFVGEGVGFSTLNLDGHYNFYTADKLDLYGLAGINFAFVKVDDIVIPGFGTVEGDTNSELGLNIGGGVNFLLTDVLGLFGEVKYVIGDADQIVITAGALYSF